MASDKDRKRKGNFINKPQEGRKQRHGGTYPIDANYIAKEGRRLAPLPRRLPR
jgi:hypothetical protein